MINFFSRFVFLFVFGSLFATQGQSKIVYSNLEIVLTSGSSWDIDGDETSETRFFIHGTGDLEDLFYFIFERDHIDFIRADTGNAGILGIPLQDLPRGFSIRADLQNYDWAEETRGLLGTTSYNQEEIGGLADSAYSYIGFRFDGDRTTPGRQNLYGWAEVIFSYVPQYSLTIFIRQWAYEDVIGEAIAVGATGVIPEPTSASLGLLALGAVGLRRWRKGFKED